MLGLWDSSKGDFEIAMQITEWVHISCSETSKDNVIALYIQKLTSYRWTDHPNYNPNTMDYDLSLLKLPNAVDFASYPDVFPACWPTRGEVAGEWVKPEITLFLQLSLDTHTDQIYTFYHTK